MNGDELHEVLSEICIAVEKLAPPLALAQLLRERFLGEVPETGLTGEKYAQFEKLFDGLCELLETSITRTVDTADDHLFNRYDGLLAPKVRERRRNA